MRERLVWGFFFTSWRQKFRHHFSHKKIFSSKKKTETALQWATLVKIILIRAVSGNSHIRRNLSTLHNLFHRNSKSGFGMETGGEKGGWKSREHLRDLFKWSQRSRETHLLFFQTCSSKTKHVSLIRGESEKTKTRPSTNARDFPALPPDPIPLKLHFGTNYAYIASRSICPTHTFEARAHLCSCTDALSVSGHHHSAVASSHLCSTVLLSNFTSRVLSVAVVCDLFSLCF